MNDVTKKGNPKIGQPKTAMTPAYPTREALFTSTRLAQPQERSDRSDKVHRTSIFRCADFGVPVQRGKERKGTLRGEK
jgi:hypothetical protein